jgi:hypothetical protein
MAENKNQGGSRNQVTGSSSGSSRSQGNIGSKGRMEPSRDDLGSPSRGGMRPTPSDLDRDRDDISSEDRASSIRGLDRDRGSSSSIDRDRSSSRDSGRSRSDFEDE